MNFLQLVQRAERECGVPGSGPSAVTAQTGEHGRFVNWVADAYNDIQTKHQDWDWMRTSTSWTTSDGVYRYSTTDCGIASGTFGMWAQDTFRNYPTAAGVTTEITMSHLGYDNWRDTYLLGGTRATRSRPVEFAVGPDKAIYVGPVPASGYTMTADYFTAPVILAADGDTPLLPTQYQMVIVYRAMMSYGAYESASEVYQRGELEFNKLMRRLEIDRLPPVGFAGPLA